MNWCLPKHVIASRQYWHLVTWNQKSIKTRMHSSRMRTVRCSGRLSCHVHPLPHMSPPPFAMYTAFSMHPLPCMPSATHTLYHAYPPPILMSPWFASINGFSAHPAIHTLLSMHAPFTTHFSFCHAHLLHHTHSPSPCMPPFTIHPPPPDRMTDACENITFPQSCGR